MITRTSRSAPLIGWQGWLLPAASPCYTPSPLAHSQSATLSRWLSFPPLFRLFPTDFQKPHTPILSLQPFILPPSNQLDKMFAASRATGAVARVGAQQRMLSTSQGKFSPDRCRVPLLRTRYLFPISLQLASPAPSSLLSASQLLLAADSSSMAAATTSPTPWSAMLCRSGVSSSSPRPLPS